MYEDKQDWYFSFVRRDIEPLLPQRAKRVLELGCGGGGTLAWLRETGRAQWTAGIELVPEAAAVARTRVDHVLAGDVNALLPRFEDGSFDLVLCLDLLEHLVDPWQTLRQVSRLIRPGGQLIASLPNVRHHSVLLPLLFSGRWQYEDAGIMDRTHLRFFSRRTALHLIRQTGLAISAERCTYQWGSYDKWKDWATLSLLRGFWAFQYLIRGDKPYTQLALATDGPPASAA